MAIAIFKSYDDGFYTFIFDGGEDMVFEEVHPKILGQYNLKSDESLIDKTFQLSFSEHLDGNDDDLVYYRIETLKLIP